MRHIVKAFRRPPTGRLRDPEGGYAMLSDCVAHGFRCTASPRRTLRAENLAKPSVGVIIYDLWYYARSASGPMPRIQKLSDRRAIASWCFYDWANSAFPTVIGTFIFGTYFTKAIAETPEIGSVQWGWALGLAGILVAVLSPVFGAIADQGGRRKPWLGFFTALCVAATALLWFAYPDASSALWALTFVALASAAFEFTMVFYNAMLPEIAPKSHLEHFRIDYAHSLHV